MSKADLEINGQRYSVACTPGQEPRLEQLGVRLDRRVRQIAGAVGDIGEARLLLIASLALLDEIDAAREGGPIQRDQLATNALMDAAARIEALATRLGTQ